MSPESSVIRRSHPLWTAVLAFAALTVPAAGCIVVDDDHDDEVIIIDDDPPPVVEVVPIDEGGALEADPGEGVGVFVEYRGAGEWNVWVTCDTEFSGFSCAYDLFVTAPDIVVTDDVDLESDDFLDHEFDTLHAGFDTDRDVDGVTFSIFEGDPIELEVWLDGEPNGSLVFWTANNGDIFEGMPSNPAIFQP